MLGAQSSHKPLALSTLAAMTLEHLFESNRAWARETEQRTPGFFSRLQAQQTPQYLWIGCSDSRVPATEICGLLPGDIFVHRNVANVVAHSDLNCLAVMEFAVDLLKVKHIMVVGHWGCSGVHAAVHDVRIGVADNWIRHVKDVRVANQAWLAGLADDQIRHNALCELNVLAQCRHVCDTTVVQDAWERGQAVMVHGWVYGLHNGLIEDMRMSVASTAEVETVYDSALQALKARYARP